MIKKAISLDKNSEYFNLDIEKMSYKKTLMWCFQWRFFITLKIIKKVLSI